MPDPTPPPAPAPSPPDRLGPIELLGHYLVHHATVVCGASCLLCVDTMDYLARTGALPERIAALVADREARRTEGAP
jgi:hypothetical protein